MLKENLTPTIIKEKVSQFLKNNGTIYTEEEKKIILDNCLSVQSLHIRKTL